MGTKKPPVGHNRGQFTRAKASESTGPENVGDG